jgi:acetoacetyl-CoA synthetase
LAKALPFVEYTPPEPGEISLPPLLRYLEQVNMGAYEVYRPGGYSGSAYFIRARRQERRECNPMPVWSRVVQGGLSVERVPGGHFDMMTDPLVRAVAKSVAGALG